MKKQTTKMITPVLALVVLIVLTTALAEPAKDPVYLKGDVILTGPATAKGTAAITIRGEELKAKVMATIKDMVISEEGVLQVKEIEHVFTMLDEEGQETTNSFTASGRETGDPTEEFMLFTLNGYMKIISGTGEYEGASGTLSVHGQLHLFEGWGSYESRGAISL